MSTLAVNAVTDANGGNTATINSMTPTADSLQGFRNRIINGDMRIDQRNAGASITPTSGQFLVDRWGAFLSVASKFTAQQNAGAVTPPAGFSNYLGFTSTSAYSIGASEIFGFGQCIEGSNISDLAWGTANAKPLTISFWVRSSLTGQFGGFLKNGGIVTGGTYNNLFYPFSYTINSANTWEFKTVVITPPTTGGWETGNGPGIAVCFSLGAGSTVTGGSGWSGTFYLQPSGSVNLVSTNGATLYITGIQAEVGSVATPFERRPYELALCQRYFEKSFPIGTAPADNINTAAANTTQFLTTSYSNSLYVSQNFNFQVSKRAGPTMTFYAARGVVGTDGAAGQWRSFVGGAWVNHSSTTTNQATNTGFIVAGGYSSGGTTGQAYFATGEWAASAEL